MVILDNKAMLTAGNNQYLQPDYLSPLSTTLDSKKSPLALLAQTCSQIGADSPKTPSEKNKEGEDRKDKAPSSSPTEKSSVRCSPAFKPYETSHGRKEDLATASSDEKMSSSSTPSSSSSSSSAARVASSHAPSSQRPSSSSSSSGGGGGGGGKEESGRRSGSDSLSSGAAPVIRSGLEVLAGHPRDLPLGTYRPGLSPFLPPGYPGLESHPALRGAHAGLFPSSLLSSSYPLYSSTAAAASASSLLGGLGSVNALSLTGSLLGGGASSSPYMSYTRVKVAGGGEAVVPVCRDPFCTGCPYSPQNNHLLLSGGACPPSCPECERAKAALSSIPGLASVPPSSLVPASALLQPNPLSSPAAAAAATAAAARPFVCNWVAGDAYCGKRFGSSEELLQHLRSHTATHVDQATALSLLSSGVVPPTTAQSVSSASSVAAAHAALLGTSTHAALQGLHHHAPRVTAAPPPTLSPLTAAAVAAAARYHPYSKPIATHPGLTPPSLSSLSHYPGVYPPGYPYPSLYPRPPL